MADAEKVLSGLEACVEGECVECPYYLVCSDAEDFVALARDALEILKVQQPRVLTLDEVEDALGKVVWIESPNCDNTSERYALVSTYSRKTVYYLRDFECGNDMRMYLYTEYNKTWRCWNKRPTDAERKAAKWDD